MLKNFFFYQKNAGHKVKEERLKAEKQYNEKLSRSVVAQKPL